MKTSENSRLRIYASSTDKVENKPVYEYLVYLSKKKGLAGATVLRGVMGYGASSVVHSSKLWELTEKLPIVIEIIDNNAKVLEFYNDVEPVLKKMPKGCLVTMEPVEVLLYKEGVNKF